MIGKKTDFQKINFNFPTIHYTYVTISVITNEGNLKKEKKSVQTGQRFLSVRTTRYPLQV